MLRLGAGDRSSATEERARRHDAPLVTWTCGTCNRRRGRWPTITIRLANLTGNNTRKHVKEKGGKWANSRGRKHVRDDLQ